MKIIKNIKVMVDEDMELPFRTEMIRDGKYIRIDLDGKERNLLYISKQEDNG